ncbi:MAG: glycerol kinase [Chloroflexi bacterium]|nr:MAG: glycerol kinase [Chloroflexota bacterium]
MADYILAIDQSTHNTKCVIFNRRGQPVSEHSLKHRQIRPEAGWLEHYPLEIWANTQVVISEAMKKASLTAADIAAIGVANQRETTVVWDRKTGRPYYNAIVWRDTRTTDICRELSKEGGQDRFRDRVGLPVSTYFSATKLKWLFDNVDGLREAAARGDALFGNMDAWLIWNLTGGVDGGVHVTDVTNASRTMLMNIRTTTWDDDMCRLFEIPPSVLPEIRPSSDPAVYGYTRADGPLGGRVPVCGILGSQQAAAVGHLCLNPGEVKNSYDGASFMIMNTGQDIVASNHGLLTTVCYQFGDGPVVYALEGSIAFTGLIIEWLRDNLKIIRRIPEIETLAQTVSDNGGIYFVPAFKGLFAPYWREDARGVIVGLTRYIRLGHLARAALEAIAYQTRDILEAMKADINAAPRSLKSDGYMTTNNLLMQFQADILGIPVIRPKIADVTAFGAAYAAGLASGFWEDPSDVHHYWTVDKVWYPQMLEQTADRLYQRWKKAVTRSFGWIDELEDEQTGRLKHYPGV